MGKKLRIWALIALVIISLNVFGQKVNKLWETDAVFSGPESVVYDPVRQFLYVSNFTKLSKGCSYGTEFISKLNLDGEIVELKWITDVSQPLGITIFNDQLYITERQGVAVYDLASDKMDVRYRIDSCKFLNDITINNDSTIYISESNTQIIYALKNGKCEIWLNENSVAKTNGLLYRDGELIVASNGNNALKAIDVTTKTIRQVAQMDEGILDGIRPYGNDLLVTHFEGSLYRISNSGEITELLNTRDSKTNLADFDYIPEKKMLIIPGLWNNKVAAYLLE